MSETETTRQTHAWETVYVFVSSTFNDMHAERDFLVKEVFPELRDFCEERKLRLVDIDLRWGVSEADATRNQRVVDVCLQNIDRCRPFFLCFLGQRYGWIPGMGDVSGETLARFPGLKAAMAEKRSVTELEVLHAVLAPFVGREGEVAADQSFFYLRDPSYLSEMPDQPAQLKRVYTDEAEMDPQSQTFLVERQRRLREAVCSQAQRPARRYSARWNPEARTPELAMPLTCPSVDPKNRARWQEQWQAWASVRTTITGRRRWFKWISGRASAHSIVPEDRAKAEGFNAAIGKGRLEDFLCAGRTLAEVILEDLKAAILARYPGRAALPEQDDLENEIERHRDFIRTATDVFVEREGDLADLDVYAGRRSRKLFVLLAKAGVGKSALLARWVARWQGRPNKPAGESVHARFVGVGERSNSVDSLLRSILEELRRAGKLTSEIPDNVNVLRSKFCQLLGECGEKGRTIVVIDALNQLQSGLTDLDWLGPTLPDNVKLVVSFKLGDEAGDALAAKMRRDERIILSEVKPFASLEQRRRLVAAFLAQYLKELDEQHLEALIRSEGADNPLFLKVVLTELRVFGAFAQLGEVIKQEFGNTPQSAFDAVLRRLENDPSYTAISPKRAVPLLFGLLAYSRGGLPEDLLVDIFTDSGERPDAARAAIRLLLSQVRPFLARREARIDFFYEAFLLAARRRYSGDADGQRPEPAWHGLLARTCQKWRTLAGPSQRYALGNLVQHAVTAGTLTAAAQALTEFGYHHVRLGALGTADITEVTRDFATVTKASGLRPNEAEHLGIWSRFHAENAHRLRREGNGWVPRATLVSCADSHASDSPVTLAARRWVEHVGSAEPWLRQFGIPHAFVPSPCLRTLEGHTCRVNAVALHADGRRAVSAAGGFRDSKDKTLKVWDLETGECLRTLQGHTGSVLALALHADGRRAVSGADEWDTSLKVWNLETGECLRTLQGHTDKVNAVSLHADGRRVVSASEDGTLKIWSLDADECLATLRGHIYGVHAVALHPDGRRAVSASHDRTLKVWDLETGECLLTLQAHVAGVNALALHVDGRRAVSAGEDNEQTLKVWDLDTGECLVACSMIRPWRLDGHTDSVLAVALHADGRRVLSASLDGTLKLWDLETRNCLRTLKGHADSVLAVALHADGRRAVSVSSDETLKVWDLDAGECESERHTDSVLAVVLHADGRRAVSASSDHTLKVWDLDSGGCLLTLWGHKDTVGTVTLHADGRRVVSGSSDTTLKVWDIDTGECLRTLEGHRFSVMAVALHADGRRVVSASPDGTLEVWDLDTGECLRDIEGHASNAVSLIADSWRAISASREEGVKVWDLNTGECLQTLDWQTDESHALALHAHGRRALSASHDKTLKVWDLDTGECLTTLDVHTDEVNAVAAHADGRRVVAAAGGYHSTDKTLTVWDLETGECLRTQRAESAVNCCIWRGEEVLAGCGDGRVLLWMPPGRLSPGILVAAWHPSRLMLALGRRDRSVTLCQWHPESGHLEELALADLGHLRPTSLRWSSDGALLVVRDEQDQGLVLDGTALRTATARDGVIWFSPTDTSHDGRWQAKLQQGQLQVVPTAGDSP